MCIKPAAIACITLWLASGCAPADPIECPDDNCGRPLSSRPNPGAGDGSGAAQSSAQSSDAVEACVRWLRNDCDRFDQCFPTTGCHDTEDEMRARCRQDLRESGCSRPDPSSFDRCADRVAGQTCEAYCPGGFCFTSCYFGCLD